MFVAFTRCGLLSPKNNAMISHGKKSGQQTYDCGRCVVNDVMWYDMISLPYMSWYNTVSYDMIRSTATPKKRNISSIPKSHWHSDDYGGLLKNPAMVRWFPVLLCELHVPFNFGLLLVICGEDVPKKKIKLLVSSWAKYGALHMIFMAKERG